MKVSELIELLAKVENPDATVAVLNDESGVIWLPTTVQEERHEDSFTGATTLWLRASER